MSVCSVGSRLLWPIRTVGTVCESVSAAYTQFLNHNTVTDNEIFAVVSTGTDKFSRSRVLKVKGNNSGGSESNCDDIMISMMTELQRLLYVTGNSREQYTGTDILRYLLSLSASGLHLALSELGVVGGAGMQWYPPELQIRDMLKFFVHMVERRLAADFVQAALQVFLKNHGDELQRHLTEIYDHPCTPNTVFEIRSLMQTLEKNGRNDWDILQSHISEASAYLKFLSHSHMEA
eukprot:Lankesteria_metandrocarpae@DN48_c0_g1_i1.p1